MKNKSNKNIGNQSGLQAGKKADDERLSQNQQGRNTGIGDDSYSQGRAPQDLQGQGGSKTGQGRNQSQQLAGGRIGDPSTGDQSQNRSQNQQSHKPSRSQAHTVNVESYLKGVDFPANKQDLISRARQNDAPENIVRQLNQIADQDYNSPVDITKAMSGNKASNE